MTDPNQHSIIQKGHVLLDQGRYREALRIYKDGLSRNPTDGLLLYYLALAQYHLDDLKKQSLQTINEALKYQNENPAFYQLKALILGNLKKTKEAMEAINHALAMDPEYAHAHAAKGYIFCLQEKWAQAEKCAKKSLSIDADNQFAGSVLANALRMQNKLDESVHLTSDLLAKDPDDSISHCNAGWVHLHKKNYEKAQTHFKESLRLDPNFEPARSGMLEAFKTRSVSYRLYLQYNLFMSQQTKAVRMGIIVGIYLAFRMMSKHFKTLFQGPWVVLGYGIVILFYLFLFWSWLAGGIGNLLVLTDKMARYALNKGERLDAIFVGGGFFLGILLLLLSLILKSPVVTIFSVALILSTLPFSITFRNQHKAGKVLYGGIGIYILITGLIVAVGWHYYGEDMPSSFKALSGFALIAFILSTWLGSFGLLRE